ncbi:MAG TPA: helix-hairpin-helix domain-containing protein [Acidimicrobiia bacterium]|nr:helix-hairpin-helix domain-containing protein [Acidimicrobiia bacterium]
MHHLDSAVRPAIAATLVAIALRISGVVTMSNLDAIPFETSWHFGFLPNFGLVAPPHVAADIATKATLIMLAGTILRLLPNALKRSTGPVVIGKAVGVLVAIETLGLSAYLHTRQPPVLAGDLVSIAVALSAAGVVIGAVALRRAEWPVPIHRMVRTVVSPPRAATVEKAAGDIPAADLGPQPEPTVETEATRVPAARSEPAEAAPEHAAELVAEMQRLWPSEEPELIGEDEPVITAATEAHVAAHVAVGDRDPVMQVEGPAHRPGAPEAGEPTGDASCDATDPITIEPVANDEPLPVGPEPPVDELQLGIRDEDGVDDDVRVDLNGADADQLVVLPGLGPSLAAMIVTFRQHAGAFETIEDLTAIAGIGPKTLDRLRDRVAVARHAD